MPTYQLVPTFYRVTWTNNSPTDYSAIGGIIPFTSVQLNNMVSLTNTVTGWALANGDAIICNDYIVGPFTSSSTLADVITSFNNVTQLTGVMASQTFTGYITLYNINSAAGPISLNNKTGTPLSTLGFTSFSWLRGSPIYGSTFGSISNGNYVVINNTKITFIGSTITSAIAAINATSYASNVVAVQYTNKIQLNSLDGSPIYFGTGSSGTSVALGFADSTAYGGNMTQANAISVERAYLNYKGIINSVESITNPILWSEIYIPSAVLDGTVIPTSVNWTIGIADPTQLYTTTIVGEPETVGTQLYGIPALIRLMARALSTVWHENCKVYNNTLTIRAGCATRANPVQILHIKSTALDTTTNIHNIEGNFAVSIINNS